MKTFVLPGKDRKIPTILGFSLLLFLLAALVVGTKGVGQVQKLLSKAQGSNQPAGQVEIANRSDDSFTVFWTTIEQSPGAVFYGKSEALGDGVAVDERNLSSPNEKYKTHFVKVSGLQPQTKYYFKVGSSDASFGDLSRNGDAFEVTTGPKLSVASGVTLVGKALNADGSPAAGAIVYWEASGADKVAALVKADGSYVLPIGWARKSDLTSYFVLSSGLSETVVVDGGGEGKGVIECVFSGQTQLPTVKLGQTLDCSSGENSVSLPEASSDKEEEFGKFKTPTGRRPLPAGTGNLQVNIVSGQTVSTPLPTFSGKAGAKQKVKIVVHSEVSYSGTVIAGPDGSWSWTPPASLTPGEHTVTITVVNADGTTQTVTRTFFVTAGQPILPVTSGTPSGQTTHLACVANSCMVVDGSGADSCSNDADCASGSPPPPPPPVPGVVEDTLLLLVSGMILISLSTLSLFGVLKVKSGEKNI